MTSNFLLLNSEKKTEVLIIGPKTSACNNLEYCLTLDGCSVNSSSSVGKIVEIVFSINNGNSIQLCQSCLHTAFESFVHHKKNWIRLDFLCFRIRSKHFDRKG